MMIRSGIDHCANVVIDFFPFLHNNQIINKSRTSLIMFDIYGKVQPKVLLVGDEQRINQISLELPFQKIRSDSFRQEQALLSKGILNNNIINEVINLPYVTVVVMNNENTEQVLRAMQIKKNQIFNRLNFLRKVNQVICVLITQQNFTLPRSSENKVFVISKGQKGLNKSQLKKVIQQLQTTVNRLIQMRRVSNEKQTGVTTQESIRKQLLSCLLKQQAKPNDQSLQSDYQKLYNKLKDIYKQGIKPQRKLREIVFQSQIRAIMQLVVARKIALRPDKTNLNKAEFLKLLQLGGKQFGPEGLECKQAIYWKIKCIEKINNKLNFKQIKMLKTQIYRLLSSLYEASLGFINSESVKQNGLGKFDVFDCYIQEESAKKRIAFLSQWAYKKMKDVLRLSESTEGNIATSFNKVLAILKFQLLTQPDFIKVLQQLLLSKKKEWRIMARTTSINQILIRLRQLNIQSEVINRRIAELSLINILTSTNSLERLSSFEFQSKFEDISLSLQKLLKFQVDFIQDKVKVWDKIQFNIHFKAYSSSEDLISFPVLDTLLKKFDLTLTVQFNQTLFNTEFRIVRGNIQSSLSQAFDKQFSLDIEKGIIKVSLLIKNLTLGKSNCLWIQNIKTCLQLEDKGKIETVSKCIEYSKHRRIIIDDQIESANIQAQLPRQIFIKQIYPCSLKFNIKNNYKIQLLSYDVVSKNGHLVLHDRQLNPLQGQVQVQNSNHVDFYLIWKQCYSQQTIQLRVVVKLVLTDNERIYRRNFQIQKYQQIILSTALKNVKLELDNQLQLFVFEFEVAGNSSMNFKIDSPQIDFFNGDKQLQVQPGEVYRIKGSQKLPLQNYKVEVQWRRQHHPHYSKSQFDIKPLNPPVSFRFYIQFQCVTIALHKTVLMKLILTSQETGSFRIQFSDSLGFMAVGRTNILINLQQGKKAIIESRWLAVSAGYQKLGHIRISKITQTGQTQRTSINPDYLIEVKNE